jgi:hypothetical protein
VNDVPRRPHCERTPHKIKFLNSHDAERKIERLNRQHPAARRAHQEPYLCSSCGYYHLYTPHQEESSDEPRAGEASASIPSSTSASETPSTASGRTTTGGASATRRDRSRSN